MKTKVCFVKESTLSHTLPREKKGVGVAVFLCCAGRLRYVPQAPLRSFRDATGGCVSLRFTARPFAAPLHFAPPEAQARRLLRAYVATQRTLAPAGTQNTTHTVPSGD